MQSSANDALSNSQEQDQQLRAQVELLRSTPDQVNGSRSPEGLKREPEDLRDHDRQQHQSTSPGEADGYDPADSQETAARALNHSKTEADSFIHPDLRAIQGRANMMSMAPPPPSGHSPSSSNQSSPNPMLHPNNTHHHNTNLAPAPPPPPAGEDPTSPDGRSRPKRELSQSKRAAQNRAAQRAFRQRKETYIRQLELENKTYQEMEKNFKGLQSENFALRDYVIALQSRLLDVQGDFPPPPPNVNLSQGPAAPEHRMDEPDQNASTSGGNDGTPLEAVARAVAGLAAQEQMNQDQYANDEEMKEEPTEDTRTADEINRHLQPTEAGTEQTANQ